MNGDLITSLDYQDLFNFHKQHGQIATIGAYRKHFKIDLGIIKNDADELITDYIEKPVYAFTVSMGIYVFELEVLNYIESHKYLDFPDLVKHLLAHGKKVVSYPFDGYWLEYRQSQRLRESGRGIRVYQGEAAPCLTGQSHSPILILGRQRSPP